MAKKEEKAKIKFTYNGKLYFFYLDEWRKQQEFIRKKEAELFPEWLRRFLSK